MSHFDELDELTEEMRATKQRLADVEQEARQPRLAMETDVPSDTKTRNRMENIVADRLINGDSSSANQVDPDQICLTSFGDDFTRPPALPCSRDAALADNGAAAPKPYLSPMAMRTVTATQWLISHRQSLYSDDDHLSPAMVVLPDQRDKI